MTEMYHIVDTPLSPDRDFKYLREEGLAYVQMFSGNEWTNLNPSDPGITILDQVCYALTELGYCNNFSVKDILTKKDGKLEFKNQFYLPEQILTTSPITILDYKKYVIDGVEAVENLVIEPVNSLINIVNGVYQVYLSIDPAISDPIAEVCNETFFLLNKSRNLGELFLMPKPLIEKIEKLYGSIEIESIGSAKKILGEIRDALAELVFPRVPQNGYEALTEAGIETNDIFNGPILRNGWIKNSDLKDKKNTIHADDITHAIEQIKGVVSVSNLHFVLLGKQVHSVSTSNRELLYFDLLSSIYDKNLEITSNGKSVYSANKLKDNGVSIAHRKLHLKDISASIQLQPKVPKGRYRDINSYYSIQNTFPEIFSVGSSALDSNATSFQIAQSRQLKGYLTLFDQQLANQFSQLANIGSLFSFVNSNTGDPSDRKEYYDQQSILDRKDQQYPVPYLQFSPTYFYQSLYDVPHIRPMLKDNETFDFSLGFESKKELERQSWNDYKNDPYNGYIWGLMQIMEDDQTSLERRNDILDHLLARHGESPELINSIIEDSIYVGDSTKDQIIFKSLLLQNLGLLSYYRQKATNFIGADKLSPMPKDMLKVLDHRWLQDPTTDSIFNSKKIDRLEKVAELNFVNYSGLELKLGLLFGLKVLYKFYIRKAIDLLEATTTIKTQELIDLFLFLETLDADIEGQIVKKDEEWIKRLEELVIKYAESQVEQNFHEKVRNELQKIKQSLWMIEQQKGVILIETNLLIQSLNFEIVLTEAGKPGNYYFVNGKVNYPTILKIEQWLQGEKKMLFSDRKDINIDNINYKVTPKKQCDWDNELFQTTPDRKHKIAVKVSTDDGSTIDLGNPIFQNTVLLIFPYFIDRFRQPAFEQQMALFLESSLPVQVVSKIRIISSTQLADLIPKYCAWRNNLRYVDPAHLHGKDLEKDALELSLLVAEILIKGND